MIKEPYYISWEAATDGIRCYASEGFGNEFSNGC